MTSTGLTYLAFCDRLTGTYYKGTYDALNDVLDINVAKTLVICGDDDIPSFLDAAHLLVDAIRGAKLEWIPNTRHASVLESPDSAILIMKQYLQS